MRLAQSTRHTHRPPATHAALIRTETLQRPSRLKLHCSVYWPLEVWGELTNPSAPVLLISHPGARVQLHITTSSSYVGAGELNLGPHTVKTNRVPIKLSPQPQHFSSEDSGDPLGLHACKESSSRYGCLPLLLYLFLYCAAQRFTRSRWSRGALSPPKALLLVFLLWFHSVLWF